MRRLCWIPFTWRHQVVSQSFRKLEQIFKDEEPGEVKYYFRSGRSRNLYAFKIGEYFRYKISDSNSFPEKFEADLGHEE